MKKPDIVTVLGIIALTYWVIDIINNYLIHNTSWSLWLSSIGIGLTAISLLTRNTFLMSSLFCALFVIESFWSIGFFSHFFFQTSAFGLTDYLFDGTHSINDFLITSYHLLIAPFLLIGILREKALHKKAWVGAVSIVVVVCALTYFLTDRHETINCVHSLKECKTFLFFLDNFSNPLRTALGIMVATITIFIPTNYVLVKVLSTGKRYEVMKSDRITD